MPSLNLALMGFGNVGRGLGRLLIEKRAELQRRYDLSWRVTAIATSSHGRAFNPDGIDLERALELAEAGEALDVLSSRPTPEGVAFIRECKADLLFETTPVNYETGQPAIDHLEAALRGGMHAITANKGAVVHAYRRLTDLAHEKNRRFYFESAVMDGAPIFSLWREALPGCELRSFRGILNSTTNMILTLMEDGKSFDDALDHCRSIGIAETDPSGDILGWDAAVKIAALVTVLMDTSLAPDEVDRRGIEGITSEMIEDARRQGKRWRLICSATREGDRVQASVGPQLIEPRDTLFNVTGTSSSVTFLSDALGPLTITEESPGPRTTAYGLLADLLNAVRR
ncbi:MAG: homoserine dehydrogenase [Chloroflexi bacterium RBG_19FT_COMBO_62_14]|nr:MAG: homoserine dehydrogenase [Chloroflexi bacterium RBG_19FT_COMBO_62_14]